MTTRTRMFSIWQNENGQKVAACQDCDWRGPADELHDIADFGERVYPGEPCPAGECPRCGALAHFDFELNWITAAALALAGVSTTYSPATACSISCDSLGFECGNCGAEFPRFEYSIWKCPDCGSGEVRVLGAVRRERGVCELRDCIGRQVYGGPGQAVMRVNDVQGDGSWSTRVCQKCADALGLRDGCDLPEDRDWLHEKLRDAAIDILARQAAGGTPT